MITKEDILEAQHHWADTIVEIGSLKSDMSTCEKTARALLNQLYAFEQGDVLFKPTQASVIQFRTNFEGMLSYFIGGNSKFPEDQGFALKPWTRVRFENAGITLENNRAIAMGNYYFTDDNNQELKVEYTFGYIKNNAGELKIDLHHSSMPYV
ncbi:hypothetical protein ACFL56_00485 [Candidatus Margulisiibacteriota bacterium]